MRLEAYSVTDHKFAAKHQEKSCVTEVSIGGSGCTSGFFRRHDCFEIPWSQGKRALKVKVSGSYSIYDKTATGFISAIAKRAWCHGFTGIISFTAGVLSVINEGDIDLSLSNSLTPRELYPLGNAAAAAYNRDAELGAVFLEPEVHLRDRITELYSGEYKKEWRNPDGLTIEEFLKQYMLDPHSKEEIIKV
jgi:hypothetical protein